MGPIKGINQIAQTLRQKIGERKLSQVKSGTDGAGSNTAPSAAKTAKAGVDEIKRKIGERISALPEEEKTGAGAAHIFVEMVMVWEFGEQLLNDPQFTELSNEVVKAMSESPAVWERMKALLSEFGGKM